MYRHNNPFTMINEIEQFVNSVINSNINHNMHLPPIHTVYTVYKPIQNHTHTTVTIEEIDTPNSTDNYKSCTNTNNLITNNLITDNLITNNLITNNLITNNTWVTQTYNDGTYSKILSPDIISNLVSDSIINQNK